MYGLERSQFNWSTSVPLWSGLIHFKILCMVLNGVNSIGLQVICFDLVWSTLKFYLWSWKESIQLVYKWSGLIHFDLLWSALKFYVWSWKESTQLVYKWSSLICFDPVWSTLKFYVCSWKESIQLVYKWSALIQFDPL